MRRIALASFVLLAAASPVPVRAEDEDPLAGLTGKRAVEFATELTADKFLGRRTGFPGGTAAEELLQSHVGNFGLHPMDPEGIYFQAFPLGAMHVSKPTSLKVGDKDLDYGLQFQDLLYTGSGVADAEVVFVGHGIVAPELGVDDYAGLDVKGKIVLAVRGSAAGEEDELGDAKMIGAKSSAAADRGAAGFLVCDGASVVIGTVQERFLRPKLPCAWIGAAVADAILAPGAKETEPKSLAAWRAARDAREPVRGRATGVRARLEITGRWFGGLQGRNVICGFNGRDPDLRDEVILVCAHHDHLGTDALDRIYPGADDNASGSGALLALAQTLYDTGWKPRRTVVFCWFAGEDLGLLGSRALVADVPFPVKKLAVVVNMDMVGQGKPVVRFGGGDGYPAMAKRALAAVPPADRADLKPFRVGEDSDHWPFHERGIPAFFVATDGDHPNYHQRGDIAANLRPECLEAAARFVGRLIVGLDRDEKPLVSGREPAEYVLREGARVVAGAASAKELAALLGSDAKGPADRGAFVDAGWAAVVWPVDERAPADGATWARLEAAVARRAGEVRLVRGSTDLVGAPRAGRIGIVPRYHCPDSARKAPADLAALRAKGVRWIDPFDPKALPSDAERDAILVEAGKAKLLVDLTGLPIGSLAAARRALKDAPATWCATAPLGKDAAAAAKALADVRTALGGASLVLLSGGAEDAVLAEAALRAPAAPGLAAVGVLADTTGGLEDRLAPLAADLAEPKGELRARVRSLFGGAFAAWLRRIR